MVVGTDGTSKSFKSLKQHFENKNKKSEIDVINVSRNPGLLTKDGILKEVIQVIKSNIFCLQKTTSGMKITN